MVDNKSNTMPSETTEKIGSVDHISTVPSTAPGSELPQVVNVNSYLDDEHIDLGWRSWMVVFVTCFAFVPSSFSSMLLFQ